MPALAFVVLLFGVFALAAGLLTALPRLENRLSADLEPAEAPSTAQ